MFLNAIIFSKLQKLYREIDTDKDPYFLVFAPITTNFSNIDFNFLNPNSPSADDIRQNAENKMAFAVCANAVVRDPKILQLNADEMLEDAYSKILNNAILINTTVSDEERNLYNNARATLFSNDNFDPTPEYSKYKEVQAKAAGLDNQILAANTLLSENANDQNLLQQKQQLELQKSIIINDWIVNGNKNKIEDAFKIVSGLNEKSAFKSNFFSEVENLKSALNLQSTINSDIEYLPTFCLPQNIYQYDFNGWVKITMLSDEITSIENDAKAFLGEEMYNTYDSISTAPVNKIEFEYLFVTIQRSWFNKDIINSSFWKFKDNDPTIVSDGANENVGILPAYTDKFIFVRRVMQYVSQSAGAPPSDVSNPVTPTLKFIDIAKLTDFSKLKSMQPQPVFQSKIRMASDVSQKDPPVLIMQHAKAAPAAPTAAAHVSSILPGEWHTEHKFTPEEKTQTGKVVILSHSPGGEVAQLPQASPPPPFPIVFVFVDTENNSITSLDINLKNVDNSADYSTLTDNAGKASFTNMIAGNYNLKIFESEVFEDFENEYNINSSLTITVTLVKRANPKFSMLLLGAINYQLPKLPNPLGNYTYS